MTPPRAGTGACLPVPEGPALIAALGRALEGRQELVRQIEQHRGGRETPRLATALNLSAAHLHTLLARLAALAPPAVPRPAGGVRPLAVPSNLLAATSTLERATQGAS